MTDKFRSGGTVTDRFAKIEPERQEVLMPPKDSVTTTVSVDVDYADIERRVWLDTPTKFRTVCCASSPQALSNALRAERERLRDTIKGSVDIAECPHEIQTAQETTE